MVPTEMETARPEVQGTGDPRGRLVAALFLALAVIVGVLAGIVIDRTLLTPPVAAIAAGTSAGPAETIAEGRREAEASSTRGAASESARPSGAPTSGRAPASGAGSSRPDRSRILPGRGSELAGGRVLAWLADSLDLSPEQKDRIAQVVHEEQAQARRLTARVSPRYRAIVRRTRMQIFTILTPEQRQRLRRLLQERRAARGRSDSGSGGPRP